MNIQDLKRNTPNLLENAATEEDSLDQELNQMLAVPSNGKLTPNPEIQKQLLARLERKKAALKPKRRLPDFARLFDLRIPIYQAAFGLAIVLLIFFISDRWMSGQMPSESTVIEEARVTIPRPDNAQFPQMVIVDSMLQYKGSMSDTFFTHGVIDSL